jgi:hypothetical protein
MRKAVQEIENYWWHRLSACAAQARGLCHYNNVEIQQ